ncbi:3-ketoacyl-CoA synthase 5-like [Diospyros lotus]|uniref:3-ketoacyl-CoA synthase 5-like n=1 Tax=Diospyros lotus TaxID=55363 RepID=UPI002252DF13|nr:3-ketoacyl-CoA synthase 5-like [Diospyros lotus]
METAGSSSSSSHGALPKTIITLLGERLLSTLLDLFTFSIFLLVFSAEAFFFISPKWRNPIFHFLIIIVFVMFFFLKSHFSKPPPIYLVDFSCLKPPYFCRVPFSTFIEHVRLFDFLDEDSSSFMSNILASSGQGERTSLPPALHYIPPVSHHHEAIKEAQMVLFPVFQDLLAKTKLSARDIDILILNCTGFCPVPSLSAMIVNEFSMRDDLKSFNISGMGCSASALAVHMAENLLKVHHNSYAVILSTEILSTGWYAGKERPMLVLNCLFRMGSAAILVTNKKEAKRSSKYKLLKTLRSQRAFDDKAYNSAFREEDSNGITGVALRKDLLQVAGEILRSNIAALGSSILPPSEIILHVVSMFWKRFINKNVQIYMPDFRSAVQHFCLPASGRQVIREIGKGLKLGEREMEATMATLHRFGNQSSSSLWYELAYMEAKERVKKGDRVWQLGMGSGPKCTSLVWECVRPISEEAHKGPWDGTINMYPNLVNC